MTPRPKYLDLKEDGSYAQRQYQHQHQHSGHYDPEEDGSVLGRHPSAPTCAQHPRSIFLGCIIFSLMLSCSIFVTRTWDDRRQHQVHSVERPWQWPEMNPWRTLAQEMEDEDFDGSTDTTLGQGVSGNGNSFDPENQQQQRQHGGGTGSIKAWDMDDPALELATFLESSDWKDQTLFPAADFLNLLRILRPVDQAFFITLFVHQKPRRLVLEEEEGSSPKTKVSTVLTLEAAAAILKRKEHRACGPWVQDYVEFQNRILDGTLPARYTVHACSSVAQDGGGGPCADPFSQLVAMVSAFAWSVTESRAFFLRTDQLDLLQESFEPFLIPHWGQPPKAESTAKVDTEPLTSQDLLRLFRLQDPLFLDGKIPEGSDLHGQKGSDDSAEDEDELILGRWWSWRSKSGNRGSFEKKVARTDAMPRSYSGQQKAPTGGQRRPGERPSASRSRIIRKLQSGMGQDGVELILDHDLLPQFVNTTKTLRQFVDLGLPLSESILRQHHQDLSPEQGQNHPLDLMLVRGDIPLIHETPTGHSRSYPTFPSSHSSSTSLPSKKANQESLMAAFHAALHDDQNPTRTRAIPKTFGCLLDILIQPQVDLLQLIHPYATMLQLPAVFSVGIYIKPSFSSSSSTSSPSPSSSSWKALSNERKETVDRYLKCARQIAREFAPKRQDQKVVFVLVSEDAGMTRVMESQEAWDEEVITPKWSLPKGTAAPSTTAKTTTTLPSSHQRAVLENWILSKTKFQVVSDQSDFARVAVWRTRREGRSIVIREKNGGDIPEGYVDMIDCGILLKNLIVEL